MTLTLRSSRRRLHALLTTTIAVIAAATVAAPAALAGAPTPTPTMSVSSTITHPGGAVHVVTRGWWPGAELWVGLDANFTSFGSGGEIGQATADSDGEATITVQIPRVDPSGPDRVYFDPDHVSIEVSGHTADWPADGTDAATISQHVVIVPTVVQVSPATVQGGHTALVTASGWYPGQHVLLRLVDPRRSAGAPPFLGVATAGTHGRIHRYVRIPAPLPTNEIRSDQTIVMATALDGAEETHTALRLVRQPRHASKILATVVGSSAPGELSHETLMLHGPSTTGWATYRIDGGRRHHALLDGGSIDVAYRFGTCHTLVVFSHPRLAVPAGGVRYRPGRTIMPVDDCSPMTRPRRELTSAPPTRY